MKKTSSDISIGGYRFRGIVDLEIESSWETLTDTGTVVTPRKTTFKGKPLGFGNSPLLKKGDEVHVQLGYDEVLNSPFEGYLNDIKAGTPIELSLQDEMWKLKQETVTRSYEEVTLSTLLGDILPAGIDHSAPGINLGQFRITRATPAQVLEELKKTYGMPAFFRDGKLYAGLAYWPELSTTQVFKFGRNIIDQGDLEYRIEDDVKIKLKMISMMPDNTKAEYETGDSEGEQRTLHYYGLGKADLKAMADEEIKKLKYTGYRGSFRALGEPFVRHGDVVRIIDDRFDRQGDYYVKAVTYTFGTGGWKQDITIDRVV